LRLVGNIENVELLRFKGKVRRAREATGLRARMPAEKVGDYLIALA
jgi:hypothetical protein